VNRILLSLALLDLLILRSKLLFFNHRAGVKESVKTCYDAGINVVMITGDHISTAVAIAKQLEIIQPNDTDPVNDLAF